LVQCERTTAAAVVVPDQSLSPKGAIEHPGPGLVAAAIEVANEGAPYTREG